MIIINSTTSQFFKVLLLFAMIMMLGSYITNKLETNYSSFEISEDDIKKYGDEEDRDSLTQKEESKKEESKDTVK